MFVLSFGVWLRTDSSYPVGKPVLYLSFRRYTCVRNFCACAKFGVAHSFSIGYALLLYVLHPVVVYGIVQFIVVFWRPQLFIFEDHEIFVCVVYISVVFF